MLYILGKFEVSEYLSEHIFKVIPALLYWCCPGRHNWIFTVVRSSTYPGLSIPLILFLLLRNCLDSHNGLSCKFLLGFCCPFNQLKMMYFHSGAAIIVHQVNARVTPEVCNNVLPFLQFISSSRFLDKCTCSSSLRAFNHNHSLRFAQVFLLRLTDQMSLITARWPVDGGAPPSSEEALHPQSHMQSMFSLVEFSKHWC